MNFIQIELSENIAQEELVLLIEDLNIDENTS
jgi:5,10-methylene-tetrahydrofolate dehydrogenase/methenyl tetrahydrofolate cyclohydrolase